MAITESIREEFEKQTGVSLEEIANNPKAMQIAAERLNQESEPKEELRYNRGDDLRYLRMYF